jgi:hypothetical protein
MALHYLALAQARRDARVPVMYLHPYELDSDELHGRPDVPLWLRLAQGAGRGQRVARRLRRLVRGRVGVPMRDVAAAAAARAGLAVA